PSSGDWDSSNQAFAISRGSPQNAAPNAWARPPSSLACSCPLNLSDPGKPSDPRTSLRVPPGSTGDTTVRLVAHWNRSTLPQVVGWLGWEFFWVMPRLRSSCSTPLRVPAPFLPWDRRVVNTMPLSVNVDAG